MTAAIEHATFVIGRDLRASPGHVFRFWSEPGLKARWNGCHPDWRVLEERSDFRPGGAEVRRWRTASGEEQGFGALYLDIVPERRIIYAYEMSFAGARLSASLVTLTLEPATGGTRVTWTEQTALLTGGGEALRQRENGTGAGLDRLAEIMEATP